MTVDAATIQSCDPCNGGLVIDGVDLMNGYAWCCTDLSDLWKLELRGIEGREVPGMDGELSFDPEIAPVTMQFPLVVVGAFDKDGNANTSPAAGLAENLAYLRANLELPAGGDGTRPATWGRADGTTLTADVKVVPPLEHRFRPGHQARAVLTLRVPAGRFV